MPDFVSKEDQIVTRPFLAKMTRGMPEIQPVGGGTEILLT